MTSDNQLIVNLSKQFYLVASTGQSYQVALELVAHSTKDKQLKTLLDQINRQLNQTDLLGALKSTGLFDEYYLQLVKAGLYSGNLDEIFLHLANHYQRQEDNTRKLRQLINYPLTMSLLMAGLLAILTTKIFPVFNDLYASMGANLTGIAHLCLQLGYLINDYFVYLIIFTAFFVVGFLTLVKLNKIKIFKKAASLTKTANDLFAVVNLIKAGISFEQTTELVFFNKTSLVEAFEDKLEPLELALLELGLTNGTYEKVLAMLLEDYQNKADSKINESFEQFEFYFMTGFVVVVAIILLSLILPLFAILAQL